MFTAAEVLDALPVAVYTTDADGRITYFNAAAAQMWGQEPALGTDKWCGSWKIYSPEGRSLPHDECPMALALKEGKPVRGVEAIIERPDGTRIPCMPHPTPIFDKAGKLTGAVNLLVDLSDRQHADVELERLAAIVASSDDAIISKTLDGRVTSWNASAERILGYTPEEMIGQPILRIIPPELRKEEEQIIAKLSRGERIEHYETVRRTKDGRLLNISLSVSPLRDRTGRVVGASKIIRDITERKQAEMLQRMLVEELNHRVKNTLAGVQAIATQTLRLSKTPADFVASFSGRIQSMARAHEILTQTRFQGADVTDIVRSQLLFGNSTDERISIEGPIVMLDEQSALHLALVLHELGTNARRHGALSAARGQLKVSWAVHLNGGRVLHLNWSETGGPKVRAPGERGFGTLLIEQSLRAHAGEVITNYGAAGLTCEIKLPLTDAKSTVSAIVRGTLADEAASLPKGGPDLKGVRVLVVEDEPLLAMDMTGTLQAAGCEVVGPASTIESALALAATSDIDVALLDANLGGESVDVLAAALTRRNIAFAFATGYQRDSLPVQFQQAMVIAKPFSPDKLLSTIAALRAKGGSQIVRPISTLRDLS